MFTPTLMCDILHPGGAAGIDPSLTVNDVMACYPASIEVLNSFGLDTCCGGMEPLRDAAEDAGVPLQVLLAAIEHAVSKGKV